MKLANDEFAASNRGRLVHAAADVFSDKGFEGASLRAIAEGAGVSFQLITYYFGSKESLWNETVEFLYQRFVETGRGLAFLATGNIHEQFRSHLLLLMTDNIHRPQIKKICYQEFLAGSERYSKVLKPKIKNIHDNHTLPYYEEVVRLGITKGFSPQEIGLLFAAVVQINIVYPYYLELLLCAPAGSPKSIELQVDFLYGILTGNAGDSEQSGLKNRYDSEVRWEPRDLIPTESAAASTAPETVSQSLSALNHPSLLKVVDQLQSDVQYLKDMVSDLSRNSGLTRGVDEADASDEND